MVEAAGTRHLENALSVGFPKLTERIAAGFVLFCWSWRERGGIEMPDLVASLSLILAIGVPLVVFASRNWIASWISKRVQHGFDVRIENIRADLRTSEERLKSDLREKEAEITSLRTSIFSGSAARQTLLDKRRFDAVEKIWTAVNDSTQLKLLSATMSGLKYEAIAKKSNDPRMQQFITLIGTGAPDPKSLKNIARDERPFVPEIVWAYYSAYSTILTFNLMRFETLKIGIGDPQKFLSADSIKNVLKAALPHQAQFIDEQDAGAYYYLLDELEAKLLGELRKILDGKEADQAAAQWATELTRFLNKANAEQAAANNNADALAEELGVSRNQ
jgi:hypothetical protein